MKVFDMQRKTATQVLWGSNFTLTLGSIMLYLTVNQLSVPYVSGENVLAVAYGGFALHFLWTEKVPWFILLGATVLLVGSAFWTPNASTVLACLVCAVPIMDQLPLNDDDIDLLAYPISIPAFAAFAWLVNWDLAAALLVTLVVFATQALLSREGDRSPEPDYDSR